MRRQSGVSGFVVAAAAAGLLLVGSDARAEHCWFYVDGTDPLTGQVSFPGFEFTKAPFQCVQQDGAPNCSWSGGACTVGGDCCTSIPNPTLQQSILAMHEDWHTCFGPVGGSNPFPGRSARWLAFHRQFEFDFGLFREARNMPCGPGHCVMGTCSNNAGPCMTDDQCSAHEGCFIESLDWHRNMIFPYGHRGANYDGHCLSGFCDNTGAACQTDQQCFVTHPRNCGTGPNRPDNIVCSACAPLPACLYNQGNGPLNGDPPGVADQTSCLGWQQGTCQGGFCNANTARPCTADADCPTVTLSALPSVEVVAQILDSSHHARFHGEVGSPLEGECASFPDPDGECRRRAALVPTDPPCDPVTGAFCPVCNGVCMYVNDVGAPTCSPRDPMFWRLHKRLDDTVRAWQETHPFDLSIVVDRSGSMGALDSSGVSKMTAASEAVKMLADLIPNGANDRVALASFGTTASPDMGLTPAATAATAIRAAADALVNRVGGCTSIGSGLEAGIAQVCQLTSTDPGASLNKPSCNPNHRLPTTPSAQNERKGILLLTDGLENRPPCLNAASATVPASCGDTCGGDPFDFNLLGPHTQVCAVGFGQAASINGNLLTLLAERQGGIYMQSPAKGPTDGDNDMTGRWIDLKDFFVKCFAQLSTEFVGIDPKGTLPRAEYATAPVPYDTCDDERLTFFGGWNESGSPLRLMVNTPSGALVRPADTAVESSTQDKYNFIRAPLPLHGEQGGSWSAQLVRPHFSYVNGFTTDALPSGVSVPLVRRQIQRLCPPTGCASVLYFEDGHHGPRSSYEDALTAEQATGLLGSVTRATDAADFNAKLTGTTTWNLIVYAHQLTEGPEPYDMTFLNRVCNNGDRVIVTETRGLDDLSSTPGPGDPRYVPFNINSCAGGTPFGAVNYTQLTGDGRLLSGAHTLTNNGYTRFSYGHVPGTLGGGTQALASASLPVAAISAIGGSVCDGEVCVVPAQQWFVDVLVRGKSQLDDAPTRFTYRTGESGILASARVLPANIPQGGYDVSDVRVEIERPTVGVGRTLLNVGQQASGATPTADGPEGRAAAMNAAAPIPTVRQTYVLNDNGQNGDLLPQNAYWSATIPDNDTPGQCLVDGMYRMHFTANFTKNGCTTRRELVRSTFVDVGVDTRVSNLTITPQTGGMSVNICPQDRCGNPSGWGRRIKCGPAPGCSCAPSDIVDHGNGCYTINVHTTPTTSTCTIDGTGKPIDVAVPVTANAGPDQLLQCAGGGATAQLDGSASRDASGAPLAFLWTAPGITFSNPTIARPTARFPVGTTIVTLTVTGTNGVTSTDTMLVTVIDTLPPVLTVPPDVTISVCLNANIGTATAVDGCGGAVTLTNNRPTRFPLGTTVVTYFAVDRFGNATSATQRVTAVLGDDTSCCPVGTTIRLGTSNNDVLNGTSGSDCILGRGAQDTINGLGGNDFISGGEGDDIIDGGSGNDQLFGGNGQDQLRGNVGTDLLDGGGGDDRCFGGDNDDVLRGGQGQDQLFGENGNDQLFGEDGDDHLEGGAGNDALNGGGLHDVCIGGPGTDTFALCQTVTQ